MSTPELRPALILAVTLAVLAAGTWAELRRLGSGGPRDESTRVSACVVDGTWSASFPLPGEDSVLRLVTNAIVPAESPAGGDVDYAIHVDVTASNGSVLLSRDLGVRSRESGVEAATTDRDGNRLTASRRVDLVLATAARPGATLKVRSDGGPTVFVRAWTRSPRTGSDQQRRLVGGLLTLLHEDREGGLLPPWDHLLPPERAALAADRFVRLAASGRPGTDHLLHALVTRPTDEEGAVEAPPALDATGGMAVTVRGPTGFQVVLTALAGAPPAQVVVRTSGASEVVVGTYTVTPSGAAVVVDASVPAGLASILITSDAPVSAVVSAPGEAHVPPTNGTGVVLPVESRLDAWPSGPAEPAVFDAEGAADPRSRLVDVDFWAPTAAPMTASLRTFDSAGAEFDHDGLLEFVPNGFDITIGADGGRTAIVGPARLRLLLPPDAVRLEVRTSAPGLVRFRVPLSTDVVDAIEEVEPVHWTHGSPDAPMWSSVRAIGTTEPVEIRTQARVEPAVVLPAPVATARVLSPHGAVTRLQALEPAAPGDPEALAEIPMGDALHVATPHGAARARVTYEIEDIAALGQTLGIAVDDVALPMVRLALTRGTVSLPSLAPGTHYVAASGPPGVRLLVDLPPAAGERAAVWRARTVWKVGPGRVTVDVPTGPHALDIVVYDPARGPRPDVSFTARVDAGAPRRRLEGLYTRLTPSSVTRSIPAATAVGPARLVDGDRASAGLARAVVVPLGDDLAPGIHRVGFDLDRSLIMRFFVYDGPAASSTIAQQEEP